MPASGSTEGTGRRGAAGGSGHGGAMGIGQWLWLWPIQDRLPGGETGWVGTVSIDGRNGDGFTPSDDRFAHIDRYTGNILPISATLTIRLSVRDGLGTGRGDEAW